MNIEPMLPSVEDCAKGTLDWPHAPPHRLAEAGVYFVTARMTEGEPLLSNAETKDWFQAALYEAMEEHRWTLEAWAVLSNHYHFVAHSPSGTADTLASMLKKLHSLSTKKLNRRAGRPGRTRLWQNFREKRLTLQRSYLARLHYVHQNAVHHGLVRVGSDWPWCSAATFKAAVTPAWLKTISSFRYDEIAAGDGE